MANITNNYSIINDSPISCKQDDELMRDNLVEMVVESIRNLSKMDHPCICYGIYGEWGSGKTSLINLIKGELLQNKNDNILIQEFNPWIVGNEETLIKEFFASISTDVVKELQSVIKRYGKSVFLAVENIASVIPVPNAKNYVQFLKNASDIISGYDKPLSKEKEEISARIIESHRHLVVFIDDIDRLDSDEVHSLFRLIRQVADFKNTIYLLAFDPDIVGKSLSKYYAGNNEDGSAFLKKIIQVPVVLPYSSEKKIKSLISKNLEPSLSTVADFTEIKTQLVIDNLAQIFDTPRQIKRYVNQLNFILPILKDEVDIADLLYLEAIKELSVSAYSEIYKQKNALLKTTIHPDPKKRKELQDKEYNEAINCILSKIPEAKREIISTILQRLFVNSEYVTLTPLYSKSICSQLYFSLYFIQLVPDELISRRTLKELEMSIDDMSIEEVSLWINEKLQEYDSYEICRNLQILLHLSCDVNRCLRAQKICSGISVSNMAVFHNNHLHDNGAASTINSIFSNYAYSGVNENDEPIFVDDIIDTSLNYIYSKANVSFALHVNYFVSQHGNGSSQAFVQLKDRFVKLDYKEQFKYSIYLLNSFFQSWLLIEDEGPSKFIQSILAINGRDVSLFFARFEDLDPNKQKQMMCNFVSYFQEGIKLLLDHCEKESLTDPQLKIYNLFLVNWEDALMTYRS